MLETFLLHIKPFKNKVYKTEDQGPGKWSLPGRPSQAQDYLASTRPWQEELARKTRRFHYRRHAPAQHAPRQGPGSDKLQSPTSSRARQGQAPRQGACRGSLHCVPTLQLIGPRVTLGPLLGRVADGCAAWGTRWRSTVVDSSPWQTETLWRELLGSTATGIKCPCPPLSK